MLPKLRQSLSTSFLVVCVGVSALGSSPIYAQLSAQTSAQTSGTANLNVFRKSLLDWSGKSEVQAVTRGDLRSYSLDDKEYRRVVSECTRQLRAFQKDGDERRKNALWLAITGAVAGAIVGPAIVAHGGSVTFSTIASGYAGFTNTAQQSLNSYDVTREESLTDREALRKDALKVLKEYLELTKNPPETGAADDDKVRYVAGLSAKLKEAELACTLYELSGTAKDG